MSPGRAALAGAGGGLLALAALPEAAAAHGLVGKQDLPIPRWLFAWAAATVLVVSFVALAALWPRPRLQEGPRERVLARVPRVLDPLCGLVGVALLALVVLAGLAGTQTASANLAPTFVYALFWVGVPFASLVLGDVFRPLNPWRAIARAAAWAAARVTRRGGDGLPEPLPFPARLGRWPAALGLLAFAWLELAYTARDDPSTLAVLALVYTVVQLVGMALYGIEPWLRHGDAFGVAFGIIARLAPLGWRDGRVTVRWPLAGVVGLDVPAGTVALLCVLIGSTSFDGLTQGELWGSVAPDLQELFTGLGLSAERALEATFTVGLVAMVLLVAALYRLGVAGMHTVGAGYRTDELARGFVHTLVPIAVAYLVAHYFSLLLYQGQALGYLASDPLGDGSDLLGTAGATIDYTVISTNAVWYVQVAALVLGHVGGLVLAHDRALALYRSGRDATRSQYWMLAVMIAFTSLGLWLLSASNA